MIPLLAVLALQEVNLQHPQGVQDTLIVYTVCYSDILGLRQRWHLGMSFTDSIGPGIAATTRANAIYKLAEMRFDTTAVKKMVDKHRREAVVHELWHIILWPITWPLYQADPETAQMLDEGTVTDIERLPLWQGLCQIP